MMKAGVQKIKAVMKRHVSTEASLAKTAKQSKAAKASSSVQPRPRELWALHHLSVGQMMTVLRFVRC
jgi:hypothetical protein